MDKRKQKVIDLTRKLEEKKDEGNNAWTNNNTKYYPDKRNPQSGPGGN